MENVTQTPPSNTATTFTVRSSASTAQSSGPPVMVLQPDGTFGIRKPAGKPVQQPEEKPVPPPGKPVSQSKDQAKEVTPSIGSFLKGSQSSGFTFKPPFGNASFGTPPVLGGATGGVGSGTSPGIGTMFGTSNMFGNTGPLSFGGVSKNQQSTSVVQSPTREEGRLENVFHSARMKKT